MSLEADITYSIFIALASALAGALVKTCDEISDSRLKIPGGTLLALLYGAIIVHMIANTPLSSLWLGAVLAAIVTGKMDKLHMFALPPIIVALIYLPLNNFSFPFFAAFFAAAVVDELELGFLRGNRPALPLAALIISLISGSWLFLTSIVFFDGAYIAASKILGKYGTENEKVDRKPSPKKALKATKRK